MDERDTFPQFSVHGGRTLPTVQAAQRGITSHCPFCPGQRVLPTAHICSGWKNLPPGRNPPHSPSAQSRGSLLQPLLLRMEDCPHSSPCRRQLLPRAPTVPHPSPPADPPPPRRSINRTSQPVVRITAWAPAFLAGSMAPSCSLSVPPGCAASQPGPSYLSPG